MTYQPHQSEDATLKPVASEDAFDRWWREEGSKAIGLESAMSFARRTWNAALTNGVQGTFNDQQENAK